MERNASVDPQAQQEMRQLGLVSVPSFKVGDEVFTGLDLMRIKRLVDYSVIACPECLKKMRIPKGKGKLRVTCPSCQHSFTIAPKK